MTDSVQVLVPGFRVIDENGEPVSGAKIKFFDAGTTNPKTVYADKDLNTSLGTEVVCDAGGYPASGGGTKTEVYVDASAYKVVITTSADVTIVTHDNCRGALDTSGISPGGGSGVMAMSVTPQTTARNITSSDAGKLIAADPNALSLVLTLDSAITLGNGFLVAVSNVAASGTNTVTIAAGGSQTIGGRGSITLDPRQTATIVCDGANFHIQSRAHPFTNLIIRIADRLTAPPGSPVAGARYIINGSPTGLWSSYAEHDIIEWDGVSSWIRWQPTSNCGWMAYVLDETVLTQYRGSAWVDLSNAPAPAVSYAKILQVYDEKSTGTGGGNPAATGAWTVRTLNTVGVNTITGASLSSDTITLPTGKYRVIVTSPFWGTSFTALRFVATSGSNTTLHTQHNFVTGDYPGEGPLILNGVIEVTDATQTFQVQYHAVSAGILGFARSLSGMTEIYTNVVIQDIAALQGPQGDQGPQGAQGDPGPGIDWQSGGWQTSTSYSLADGVENNGSSYICISAHTSSSTTEPGVGANWTDKWDLIAAKGDTGSTGPTGAAGADGTDPGLRWLFDSSTSMADPGSGDLRLNNAAFASVTAIAISAACGETGNPSVLAWLQALDDSTTSGHKGVLILKKASAPQNFVVLEITASITDNTTWIQATVSHKSSNGSFSNGDVLSVQFARTGDKGADGAGVGDVVGPASVTDNMLAAFDGTTGKLIKSAAILISSVVTNVVTALGYTPANDASVLKQGKRAQWLPASMFAPALTNGPGVGYFETSTNKNLIRTLDFDASTSESAQVEWTPPPSWNLGTVTFIPVWSHPSTTTNFGVVWALSGVARSNGDALDAAFGTAQQSADTGGTTDTQYNGPESSAITIAGTPAQGDTVNFKLARLPSDGSDTMTVDARLHGIIILYSLSAANDA